MPGVTSTLTFQNSVFVWGGAATDSNGDSTVVTEPCDSASGQMTVVPPVSTGLASTTVNFPSYDTNYTLPVVVYSVQGVVTSSGGAAIGSATVALTPMLTAHFRAAAGSATTTTYTTVTNASGFFGMKVPAGSYKLVIKSKTDGKTQPRNYSVTVKSVEINGTNLRTMAVPFVSAKVKLLGPSNTPVAGAVVTEACASSASLALSSTLTGYGTTCDHLKTSVLGLASLISLPAPSAAVTITPPSTSGLCAKTFSLNLSLSIKTTKKLTSGCT